MRDEQNRPRLSRDETGNKKCVTVVTKQTAGRTSLCTWHGLHASPTCPACQLAAWEAGAATDVLREVQQRLDLALSRPMKTRKKR